MLRTHRHFPGRYPLSNRYFVNRSRWLLSCIGEKRICVFAFLNSRDSHFEIIDNRQSLCCLTHSSESMTVTR